MNRIIITGSKSKYLDHRFDLSGATTLQKHTYAHNIVLMISCKFWNKVQNNEQKVAKMLHIVDADLVRLGE